MNQKKTTNKGLTRRQFLIGAAGASVVACTGVGYWGTHGPEINFIETSYGIPSATTPHILIAYASQYGSTGGVADAVAQALHEQGAAVDVRRVDDVRNITSYDAVLVGAPVISDEWMPEARDFVRKQRGVLAAVPTAYFLTCMTLALSNDEDDRRDIARHLEKIENDFPETAPVELGLFAGALDYNKMSPAMNVLYRLFSEDDTSGDYRDFDAIRAWATSFYPRLITV